MDDSNLAWFASRELLVLFCVRLVDLGVVADPQRVVFVTVVEPRSQDNEASSWKSRAAPDSTRRAATALS